jgi:hypothetical protein
MREIEQIAGLDSSVNTSESICARVAKIFEVRESEVALLELSGSLLNFLYPVVLKNGGCDSYFEFGGSGSALREPGRQRFSTALRR